MRLSFLEGMARSDILEEVRVHVFRDRLPMMHRDGWTGPQASSAVPYAWFAWQRDCHGPPVMHRISTNPNSNLRPAAAQTRSVNTMSKAPKNAKKPTKSEVTTTENVVPLKIVKPQQSIFEKFKSKKPPTIGGVGEQLTALPLMKISEAGDFVRISPDERHHSPELCFTSVPIVGEKRDMLHIIDEELAVKWLPAKRILRFRLMLASKPYNVFFLAIVPTTNLDNSWNSSMLAAVERAKQFWVSTSSRKAEGAESYKVDYAIDQEAFPEPKWPGSSLETLVEIAFHGRMIEDDNHAALCRLTGRKQDLK